MSLVLLLRRKAELTVLWYFLIFTMTILALPSYSLGHSYFANIWCDCSFKVVSYCLLAVLLDLICSCKRHCYSMSSLPLSSCITAEWLLGLGWHVDVDWGLWEWFVCCFSHDLTGEHGKLWQVLHHCWPPSYIYFGVPTTEHSHTKLSLCLTLLFKTLLIDGFVPRN